MALRRLFSCFRPSSHPLVLGVALVIVPAVVLVVELLVKDLVLSGEFLKVGSEISYLFLHRSHLRRLATGGKRLSVYFHRSRPDHAVLLYRCGERQIYANSHRRRQLMFQGNQWTAVRACDRAEDLQKETSTLFVPEYGGRTAFYAFRSSTWPSGGSQDLATRGGPVTLRLLGSGQIVQGAGRRREGFISGIRGGHLCTMRC
uniref:Uncharacterized protein n=1 Tax=Fagus sylvatica TaxID=28930 RepID=A0A2N9EYR6_FAGSY